MPLLKKWRHSLFPYPGSAERLDGIYDDRFINNVNGDQKLVVGKQNSNSSALVQLNEGHLPVAHAELRHVGASFQPMANNKSPWKIVAERTKFVD